MTQEFTAARAALARFFERLWPDPDDPPAAPPCLDELAALEGRYRRARRLSATDEPRR